MEDDQSHHQLNGYKFSFNRVNPYVSMVILENQENQNVKEEKEAIQLRVQDKSRDIVQAIQQNKKDSTESKKQSKIKKKYNTPQMPVQQFHHVPAFRQTKQLFTNKIVQNQKNKILIDLYLRKTKFTKIKNFRSANTDKIDIKEKVLENSAKNTNLNLSHVVKALNFSSTKQTCIKQEQNEQKQFKAIQSQRKNDHSPRTKFKKNKTFRSTKNLSESKFIAYMPVKIQKQQTKVKHHKAHFNKTFQKPQQLIKISSFTTSQTRSKPLQLKKSKPFELKIKTQITEQAQNFRTIQQHSLDRHHLNIHSTKSSLQPQLSIRSKLGALKYKSPRMLISARNNNQMFGRKNPNMKIKLFTSQQQQNIIQQYYNSKQKIKQT